MNQTEQLNEFTINVRKCEAKLQNFIAKKAVNGVCSISEIVKPNPFDKSPPAKEASNVNDDCIITDIDPNQDYESSDTDFSMDSDSEATNNNNDAVTPSQMQTAMPSPNLEIGKLKIKLTPAPSPLKMPFQIEHLCVYCDRPFLTQLERKKHEDFAHDIVAPYNCNFCEFKAVARCFIIQHIKEFHQHVSRLIYGFEKS